MAKRSQVSKQTLDDLSELKTRLAETEETLHAIQQYLVDAFVVQRSDGAHVVTLSGTDVPYRKMVDAMNEGAVTLIPDGTILYSNRHFCEMLQADCEQVIGMRFQNLIVPAEQEAFELILKEIEEAGRNGVRAEFCLQAFQGVCVPVQLSIYELVTEGARGLSIIATDLTERRRAEDALRNSEQLFRFIVTSSPDIVFSQDKDLKYTWIINPAAPFTIEGVIGKTDWDLLPPEEAKHLTEIKKKVLETGEGIRKELRLSPGGIPRWNDVSYQPTYDGKGRINGLIGYSRDITESVLAKEKIRSLASALTKAEQEERHRISQVLHDDLQQRLFAIKAQLSLLGFANKKDAPPDIGSTMDLIQKELSNAISITRSLSIDLSPSVLHGEGLAEAISWLSSKMEEQFGVQVEVESKVNLNYLDDHMRVLLFRAVRELLFNIVKHARTTRAEVDLDEADGCVHVTVKDAGTGFDVEEVMKQSNVAHGLLIVQDRLNLMGGKMKITSNPGQGTEVKIELPLEASSA